MNYVITLNNNQSITMKGVDIDMVGLASQLNDQRTQFITISTDYILSKHIITSVMPLSE